MKTLKYAAMICALFAAINAEESFAQGILINGGFESPAISPNSNQDVDPNGWSRIASSAGLGFITHLFNGNGGLSNAPTAHSGNQHFFLGHSGSGISQTITLGEANQFLLNWWTATLLDTPNGTFPMAYTVRIWSIENSSLVASNQFAAHSGSWTGVSMGIPLQTGNYLMEFQTSLNGPEIFLDDVTMVPVPEPSTYALFGLGALAFVVIRSAFRKPHVDASLAKRLDSYHGT